MKKELRQLILLMTDAYKLFHRQMYPKNTVLVYSNATARSSNHYKGNNKDEIVVFGTQRLVRLLKDKFQDFFDLPEQEVIDFCKEQLSSFTGTDYDIEHILYLHRLQYLPLVVKSLPEGTKCPIKVPYMTFYNTDPKCFWLTNYIETFVSSEIWHFVTNATIANEYREIFDKHALKTVGNTDFVLFQGHDFSARGDYGFEAATSIALAHNSSFAGGDTITGYLDAQYYYDAPQNDFSKGIITQTSVPASEHSVQCAHFNPKDENELAYLDAILDEFPTGIVSIVCDGYDFWKFLTEVVPLRKERILARNGKVVFRPDSGNIVDIICGVQSNVIDIENADDLNDYLIDAKEGEIFSYNNVTYIIEDVQGFLEHYGQDRLMQVENTIEGFSECNLLSEHTLENQFSVNEVKGAIEVLSEIFGTTETEKGYKLLNEKVGLIYGDSVTLQIADEVCTRLASKGFASINWVAGIGSYTYQFNTRDSHGQAIKATYVEFEKEIGHVQDVGKESKSIYKTVGKPIFKDPKTGDGLKKSAKGLLCVIKGKFNRKDEPYELQDVVSWDIESKGHLREIFKDGILLNQTTLSEIRNRLKQ